MDGRARHRRWPKSFEIPSKDDIKKLKVGNCVKLGFLVGKDGERMWVEITAIKQWDEFTGKLTNCPLFRKDIAIGDTIFFSRRHILSIS